MQFDTKTWMRLLREGVQSEKRSSISTKIHDASTFNSWNKEDEPVRHTEKKLSRDVRNIKGVWSPSLLPGEENFPQEGRGVICEVRSQILLKCQVG